MQPRALSLLLASATLIVGISDASAQARHERVSITEMKSKGEVVGVRIKMTLRASGQSWKDVLIGIGPEKGINNNSNITIYRDKAAKKSAGHLIHQFPAVAKPGEAQEVKFELKYKDVPELKPGQKIQIISAWRPSSSGGAIHAWGMTRYGVTEATYKLPGKANAQQQQVARRSSKKLAPKAKANKTKAPSRLAKARTSTLGRRGLTPKAGGARSAHRTKSNRARRTRPVGARKLKVRKAKR